MSKDVLNPPLLRMSGNRSYRVNLVHEDFGGNQRRQEPAGSNYVEEDQYGEDDDETIEVEDLASGLFRLRMNVASSFYGVIIGIKGATKRRIELETDTEISIPLRGSKSEIISITGKTRSAVCSARRKINMITLHSRNKMGPTHFVSVPLASEEVQERYLEFKRQVLACNFPGIMENDFQTPNCLHQTLVVSCLLNDDERAYGVQVLQSCREFLSDIKVPLQIKLQGLNIMNDDPSAVRVLYTKLESEDLKLLANRIANRFKERGINADRNKNDEVKLHMTVLNTRHASNGKNQRRKFDVRELLKQFGDFYFGMVECNELKLCVMRAEGESRDFYKITSTLSLTE